MEDMFATLIPMTITTQVPCKKLNDKAILPTSGSEYAAGSDLYACLDKSRYIPAGHTVKIPTGIAMELPVGYSGFIFARSGLATKDGLRPANCVGVVDSDYRGEVMVAIHNDSLEDRTIDPGQRIAQIVVMPYVDCCFTEVDSLSDTKRGDGGFGSSGK